MAEHQARTAFNERCRQDLLYHILTSKDPAILNPHVQGIIRLVQHRANNVKIRQALSNTLNTDDPIPKHALVLFCLHAEPSFRAYIAERSNERVLGEFVTEPLLKLVHASLTGHFANLHEFVREARSEYLTT